MKFKKIKELYNTYKKKIYRNKDYFVEIIFVSNVINGVYIIYINFIQDLQNIFMFWLKYFKDFFIKGNRSLKYLELAFFLFFPFVHFSLVGLFLYKYIFKYLFLIIDILILYFLMDIKKLFEFILKKIIDKIILVYDKRYIYILQTRYPDTYDFLFNNKYISFLSKLISSYLTLKKYIFLIFFDPFFVYIPLGIKKFKRYRKSYLSYQYLRYLVIILQNKIDSYLYEQLTETEKKVPVYRYRYRKFKRMPGIKFRQIKADWEFLKPLVTTKLGWKLYFHICKVITPYLVRSYKAKFKLYFLETIWFFRDPIAFKYFFYMFEYIYNKVKLYSYSRLNIWIYIHSFKLFLVLFFNYFLYFFNQLLILFKWIYNFCKKLIKGVFLIPYVVLKKLINNYISIYHLLIFITKIYWNILWNNILSCKLIFFIKKKINKKNTKKK